MIYANFGFVSHKSLVSVDVITRMHCMATRHSEWPYSAEPPADQFEVVNESSSLPGQLIRNIIESFVVWFGSFLEINLIHRTICRFNMNLQPWFFCTPGKQTVENLKISRGQLAPCQENRIKRQQTVSSAGCNVLAPNAGFLLASMPSYCRSRPIECSYSQSVSVSVPQDKIRGSATYKIQHRHGYDG